MQKIIHRSIIPILVLIFVVLLIFAFNVRDVKDVSTSKSIDLLNLAAKDITKINFDGEENSFILEPSAGQTDEDLSVLIQQTDKPKKKESDKATDKNDTSKESKPDEAKDKADETKPNPDEASKTEPTADQKAEETKQEPLPPKIYMGSRQANDLVKKLAKFTVLRELKETFSAEDLKTYGLQPPLSTLELTTKSGTKKFEIGKTYGSEPRTRIRNTEDGKVYVASMSTGGSDSTALNLLFKDKHLLKQKEITPARMDLATEVVATYQGRSKTFKKYTDKPGLEEGPKQGAEDWRDSENPDKKNELFTTWMENAKRASIQDFVSIEKKDTEFQSNLSTYGFNAPLYEVVFKNGDKILDTLKFVRYENTKCYIYSQMLHAVDSIPEKNPFAETLYTNIPEIFSK